MRIPRGMCREDQGSWGRVRQGSPSSLTIGPRMSVTKRHFWRGWGGKSDLWSATCTPPRNCAAIFDSRPLPSVGSPRDLRAEGLLGVLLVGLCFHCTNRRTELCCARDANSWPEPSRRGAAGRRYGHAGRTNRRRGAHVKGGATLDHFGGARIDQFWGGGAEQN